MKFSFAGLGKFDYIGKLLLRIGIGALLALHGFPLFMEGPKTWRAVGETVSLVQIDSGHVIFGLISVMAQAFGGIALIIGLFTRGAALLHAIIVSFALARTIQNGDPLLHQLVYAQLAMTCLSLSLIGPGRLSFDQRSL